MTNIIRLEEKRSQERFSQSVKEAHLIWQALSQAPTTKFGKAFRIFDKFTRYGKKRQRHLLYIILGRYMLQRPISVDEMTEILIDYNKRSFEKKRLRHFLSNKTATT
jgi:hypothetical protein